MNMCNSVSKIPLNAKPMRCFLSEVLATLLTSIDIYVIPMDKIDTAYSDLSLLRLFEQ